MEQLLLVGYTVVYCFSLLITFFILITDIVRLQHNADTYFEKILRNICHFLQIAITFVAVGCAAVALDAGVQASWMEPLFVTTLETNATMIVARNLRGFARPAWIASCFYTVGLVHAVLDLIYSIRCSKPKRSHGTYLYLSALATLAATVSAEPLYTHARAGGNHKGFRRLLIALVLSNAATASCYLGVALIVYTHSISNAMIGDQLYQALLLSCTSVQLLCPLVFCTGRAATKRRGSTRFQNDIAAVSSIGL